MSLAKLTSEGKGMFRIFVTASERRNWRPRIKRSIKRGEGVPPVTRRYLLFVEESELRGIIMKKFDVLPHESGKDDVFYCIAQPTYRRTVSFVKGLLAVLKDNLDESQVNQIEVLYGVGTGTG